MKLSILIVNWNSKEFLRKCLVSIRATCHETVAQIIVVDGGSFDGCGEMLASEYPEVVFVQSLDNGGFGRSNNIGFAHVSGGAVLLLNPDTELKPGSIQAMMHVLEQTPDAGIVGPRLLNPNGTLQKSCVRALPTPLNRALDSEFLRRLFPRSSLWGVSQAFSCSGPTVVQAVSGACMLLRSEVFRAVGGFSPEFFMYGEDMDLCAKVQRIGLRNYHVPAAEIIHYGGGSSKTQVSQFSTVHMRISGETYMRLNHGRAAALSYRVLQGVSALFRISLAVCWHLFPSRSASAGEALKKWWYVLQWALALSRIGPVATSDPKLKKMN